MYQQRKGMGCTQSSELQVVEKNWLWNHMEEDETANENTDG